MARILFLAANPLNTKPLKLDAEIRAIDQALRRSEFGDQFDLRQHWAVRLDDLQGLLMRHRPDIVHFSGHGSLDNEIMLEDDSRKRHPVPPEALSRVFSVLKDRIRCVVLNSCCSELQAKAIAEHIDSVVGMTNVVGDPAASSIGDPAAISFAAAFYEALGYGKDVKTAFEVGCSSLVLKDLKEKEKPRFFAMRGDPGKMVFAGGSR